MTISLQNHEQYGYSVLAISGKFNAVTVSEIRKASESVFHLGIRTIILDFSKTTMLDSAGIGCIIAIQKQCLSNNGKTYCAAMPQNLEALLKSMSITKVLTIVPSVADAESQLNMGVIRQERGFYVLFKLPAEFSLSAVKPLRESIEDSKGKGYVNIVFDLERCKVITSVGIGLLVNVHKDLLSRGGGLYLFRVSDDVRSILQATNILTFIRVYPNIEAIEEQVMPKLV